MDSFWIELGIVLLAISSLWYRWMRLLMGGFFLIVGLVSVAYGYLASEAARENIALLGPLAILFSDIGNVQQAKAFAGLELMIGMVSIGLGIVFLVAIALPALPIYKPKPNPLSNDPYNPELEHMHSEGRVRRERYRRKQRQ